MGRPLRGDAIIKEARRLGHELYLDHREPPPDVGGFEKWWAVCSCGYRSQAARRVKINAVRDMLWHTSRVVVDEVPSPEEARINGGIQIRVPETR